MKEPFVRPTFDDFRDFVEVGTILYKVQYRDYDTIPHPVPYIRSYKVTRVGVTVDLRDIGQGKRQGELLRKERFTWSQLYQFRWTAADAAKMERKIINNRINELQNKIFDLRTDEERVSKLLSELGG